VVVGLAVMRKGDAQECGDGCCGEYEGCSDEESGAVAVVDVPLP
jgi:hypothetical protein